MFYTTKYGTPKYSPVPSPIYKQKFLGEGLIASYNINQAEKYLKSKFPEIYSIHPIGTKTEYIKSYKEKYNKKIQNNPEVFLISFKTNIDLTNEIRRLIRMNKIIDTLYGWKFTKVYLSNNDTYPTNNKLYITKLSKLIEFIDYNPNQKFFLLSYEAKFSNEIITIDFETLYHLTENKNLNKIIIYGLYPKTSNKFNDIGIDSNYDKVYFDSDYNEIVEMFKEGCEEYLHRPWNYTMLRINPKYMNDLNHSLTFYDDVRTLTGVFTLDHISPHYLQREIKKGEWKNLI